MCSTVLPCPLCCKTNFESIDALKISLVKVTSRPLHCPICNEVVLGLDKLTIHLFSHSMDVDDGGGGGWEQNKKEESNKINLIGNNFSESTAISQTKVIPSPTTSQASKRIKTKPETANTNSPTSSSVNNGTEIQNNSHLVPEPCNSGVKCEICDFVFENQKHLSMHMNLVHVHTSAPSEEPFTKFPCHLCNKSFKMKGSLRVHLKVVHMHGFQNICGKGGSNNSNNDDPRFGTEANYDPSMLNQQMANNKSEPADVEIVQTNEPQANTSTSKDCSLGPSAAGVEAKTSPDQSKSWECDICTKTFTTKYFLKKHKRLHTGEMPYACQICGKTFTFQQSYHKHLLYHSDEKPHVCGTCGRAFKELSTKSNHERIHSGEKPFSCETCGKCFRQRVSYLVHRRIHTGAMPYKCTACSKSFRYKVSQRTHKCPAQPPGQVVRQSGELLQKLLLNSNWINGQEQQQQPPQDASLSNAEERNTEERNRIDELIDKSIEDMVKGKVDHIHLFPTPLVEEILGITPHEQQQSPTDQFQNLCLYSQDTMSEESLKDLLYTTI